MVCVRKAYSGVRGLTNTICFRCVVCEMLDADAGKSGSSNNDLVPKYLKTNNDAQ